MGELPQGALADGRHCRCGHDIEDHAILPFTVAGSRLMQAGPCIHFELRGIDCACAAFEENLR